MRDFLKGHVAAVLQIAAGILLCAGLILFRTYWPEYWEDCTLVLNSVLIIGMMSLLLFRIVLAEETKAVEAVGWFYVLAAGFIINNRLYLYSQVAALCPAVDTIPSWLLCILLVALISGIGTAVYFAAVTDFKSGIQELFDRIAQEKGPEAAGEDKKKMLMAIAIVSGSILITFLIKIFFSNTAEQGVTYEQILKSGGQAALILLAVILVFMFLFILIVGFVKNWRELLPSNAGLKFIIYLLVVSVLYCFGMYQVLKPEDMEIWEWILFGIVSIVVIVGITLIFYIIPKVLKKIENWDMKTVPSEINVKRIAAVIVAGVVIFTGVMLFYYHAVIKGNLRNGILSAGAILGIVIAIPMIHAAGKKQNISNIMERKWNGTVRDLAEMVLDIFGNLMKIIFGVLYQLTRYGLYAVDFLGEIYELAFSDEDDTDSSEAGEYQDDTWGAEESGGEDEDPSDAGDRKTETEEDAADNRQQAAGLEAE